MIRIEEAIEIHHLIIRSFGGSESLRDQQVLDSALKRPFQTFNGQELYPNPEEKAAAILESIVSNHPFIDGNKRVGYILMRMMLLESGIDIQASEDEKYNFITAIAKGEQTFQQIKSWISARVIVTPS